MLRKIKVKVLRGTLKTDLFMDDAKINSVQISIVVVETGETVERDNITVLKLVSCLVVPAHPDCADWVNSATLTISVLCSQLTQR